MKNKLERRKSYRLPFSAKIICCVSGNDYHGMIRDLSVSGCFMITSESPPISSECEIEIVLQGDNSRLRVDKLKGVVIRCDECGVGIRFESRLEWLALAPIYFHKMQEQLRK